MVILVKKKRSAARIARMFDENQYRGLPGATVAAFRGRRDVLAAATAFQAFADGTRTAGTCAPQGAYSYGPMTFHCVSGSVYTIAWLAAVSPSMSIM